MEREGGGEEACGDGRRRGKYLLVCGGVGKGGVRVRPGGACGLTLRPEIDVAALTLD